MKRPPDWRLANHLYGAGIAAYALVQAAPWFGGDDPLAPSPDGDIWHHEGLSRRAAQSAGWSTGAQNALAFHADRVDAYLYNPMWWFDVRNGGGLRRLRVASAVHDELVKVHFDDLFDTSAVTDAWRRYLPGTVAALLWLAIDRSRPFDDRVQMAQNVVGVSLHAIQDFYSHSNWIDDPERRTRTWFDLSADQRAGLDLWTGSYEHTAPVGVKPHGDYRFACTVITGLGRAATIALDTACGDRSPIAGTVVCRSYLDCRDAEALGMGRAPGDDLPPGVIRVVPGINLDSHWQAVIGARERGLEISGTEAFDVAYTLAHRNSWQWLHLLEHVMEDAGHSGLWDAVRTGGVSLADYKSPVAPFEDPAMSPYEFISAGEYPAAPDGDSDWYLRLEVDTAPDRRAGTRASIVPIIDGVRFPALGSGMRFGSSIAHVIGPLAAPPDHVALVNTSMTVRGVVEAACRALSGRQGASDAHAPGATTTVLDALRTAIGAQWHPESIRGVAFRRGTTAQVRAYLALDVARWVGPGEALEWNLMLTDSSEAPVPDEIRCACGTDPGRVEPPRSSGSVPRFARRPADPSGLSSPGG